MESQIIPLQQLYLNCLAAMFKAEKLDTVLQDTGNESGVLWLVRTNTTVPELSLGFKFGATKVEFACVTRNERVFQAERSYAEGIDSFMQELQHFLRSGRIAAPKKAA